MALQKNGCSNYLLMGRILLVVNFMAITNGLIVKDIRMHITATPSNTAMVGEELRLQCTISSTASAPSSSQPSTPLLPPTCRFSWTHAYFTSRNGPIIRTLHAENLWKDEKNSGQRDTLVYDQYLNSGKKNPSSVFVIPSMQEGLDGIYCCALMCENIKGGKIEEDGKEKEVMVQQTSIQVILNEGPFSLLERKQLAVMMFSTVVIVFVICMLLAGLVLHLRQRYAHHHFQREQQRRNRQVSVDYYLPEPSSINDKFSGSGSELPPRYSQILSEDAAGLEDANNNGGDGNGQSNRSRVVRNISTQTNERTLCHVRHGSNESSNSMSALCSVTDETLNNGENNVTTIQEMNNTTQTTQNSVNKETQISQTHAQQNQTLLCLSAKFLESGMISENNTSIGLENDTTTNPDNLYNLMDNFLLSAHFDRSVLAFQSLPEYEDVVEEKSRRAGEANGKTSTLPPSYSELSLHV